VSGGGVERRPRGFLLRVLPEGADEFGVVLDETNGHGQALSMVARADAPVVRRLLPALVGAVKASGHSKGVLSAGRKSPIRLNEEPGVRLGLALMAIAPLTKARRIQEISDGVASMAAEEAYYWYAKATGVDGVRRLRALRLFLSEE